MVWMSREQAGLLAQCAVVFEAGDPARTGKLAFRYPGAPAGTTPPHRRPSAKSAKPVKQIWSPPTAPPSRYAAAPSCG
ncbi:hypothetical protein SGLAM104S_04096 [Streptomyces glaucescens]